MTQLADSAKTLIATAIKSSSDLIHHKRVEADARAAPVVEKLERDGVAVVEGFIDAERCGSLRDEMDRLYAEHAQYTWSDAVGSDHRIHGAERFSAAIQAYHDDPWCRALGEAYLEVDLVNAFTLAGRLETKPGALGSGGGWHRDSCYMRQFKTLLYLSDVGPDHGPFQYLVGSHTLGSQLRAIAGGVQKFRKTRFTEAEVAAVCSATGMRVLDVHAPAGSLLVVNTRGLHRGKPIVVGRRYALTNYYFQRHVYGGKTREGWRAMFEPQRQTKA